MRWGGGTLGACGPACFPSWSGSALPPVPRAIGLATVSAVRAAVADDPVRVLSAADVAVLLQEPGADLDPIATLAAADSLPRGASGADEGQQVDSREAMVGRAG